MNKIKVVICLGSSCYPRGNNHVLEIIKKYLKENNLKEKVDFTGKLCSGNCSSGPVLHINDKIYKEVNEEIAVRLLDEHFTGVKI